MSLNLSTSAGFAAATLSGASNALNLLTGLNTSDWDIQEGAFGHPPSPLVLFHVFKSSPGYNGAVEQIQDTLARRVPKFRFPYVDGQTTEDLGREGEDYDFDILIFGPNYYNAYKNLIQEFNNPLPGTLVHPVRGRMVVKMQNCLVTHKSAERQAVTLKVKFIEHNFEVSFEEKSDSTKSALSKAVAFIGQIAAVITSVQSNIFALASVKQAVATALSGFSTSYTGALVAINTSFNSGSSADLPALLLNTPGSGSSFSVAESPNDPYSALTPSQIQAIQSPVLTATQANDLVASVWTQANQTIALMESAGSGQGALIFYQEILTVRQSVVSLAQALSIALQTSKAAIMNYTTPRLMTVREVCFANGIPVDDFQQVMTLNPSLLSANFIPEGITLQVPTS